jgi:hypothetical protein
VTAPVTAPPTAPDSAPVFLRLPVDSDEGFPQAFRLTAGNATYRVELHVNVAEEVLPEPDRGAGEVLDLATDTAEVDTGAFLVVAVARQDPAGDTWLLRRKVVLRLVYRAGDLLLTFRTVKVAVRNLNGVGAFGSEIVAGVAQR